MYLTVFIPRICLSRDISNKHNEDNSINIWHWSYPHESNSEQQCNKAHDAQTTKLQARRIFGSHQDSRWWEFDHSPIMQTVHTVEQRQDCKRQMHVWNWEEMSALTSIQTAANGLAPIHSATGHHRTNCTGSTETIAANRRMYVWSRHTCHWDDMSVSSMQTATNDLATIHNTTGHHRTSCTGTTERMAPNRRMHVWKSHL